MTLTDFAIQKIVPYVTGDNYPPNRSGRSLVTLFNTHGCRDVYDSLGLPINLIRNDGQRMSRKQYVEDRLKQVLKSNNIRPLLEVIINEAEDKENVASQINTILNAESYMISEINGQYKIIGGVIDRTQPIQNEAHFQDIQNRILHVLNNARVSIRVVMAWFTNEILFDKLIEKSEQGIDVQLVIYDDVVNRKHGVDFARLNHTPLKRASRGGLMHDKFCVIDNQIVITGSYNWSKNAETRNDENVIIVKDPE